MEVWRDVPGYVGQYQVSDDGNIRSVAGLLQSATDRGVRIPKRVLRPAANNKGRLQVTLCKNGQRQSHLVHRLVLLAFSGECPDGYDGLFKDGNPKNCRIDNLRWGIRSDRDAGETSPRAKLSEQDVRDIRTSAESGRTLAARYGVSQVSIHHIKTRVTWKHI